MIVSETPNCKESVGEVRFYMGLAKLNKNTEKRTKVGETWGIIQNACLRSFEVIEAVLQGQMVIPNFQFVFLIFLNFFVDDFQSVTIGRRRLKFQW